jgi:hypothetical protein
MDKQNVTLALPKETLQKIKIIAVKRNTSISAMLTDLLTEIVDRDDAYEIAAINYKRILREARSLGTYGSLSHSRDDLHDR